LFSPPFYRRFSSVLFALVAPIRAAAALSLPIKSKLPYFSGTISGRGRRVKRAAVAVLKAF